MITAGMTTEFDLISTNAPDSVIEKQLAHINRLEEQGEAVPLYNPYTVIVEEGYDVSIIGNQDMREEEIESIEIDEYFDFYDY